MYRELLKEYLEEMGETKFHVTPGCKYAGTNWHSIADYPEDVAKEIYLSLKRIENGEAIEVVL